jgi:hypothetical protein
VVKVFIIVTLLYGEPRPTLDDHVFPDPVSCHTYLHQAYDRATIECSSSIAQRNE